MPEVGYNSAQLRALETTINASSAEVVVSATPVDRSRLLRVEKKWVRARLREFDESSLIDGFLNRTAGAPRS